MSVRTAVCHRLFPLAALAALFSLAGCSSKPGDSDISHALEAAYSCPDLVISDVKKIDGVERGNGAYQMAFSYTLALKEDAASLSARATTLANTGKKSADLKALEKAFSDGRGYMWDSVKEIESLGSTAGEKQSAEDMQWSRDYHAAAEMLRTGGGGELPGPAKTCTSPMSMAWGWLTFYATTEPIKVDEGGHAEIVKAVQFKTTADFVKADSGWLLAALPSSMADPQVVKERVKINADQGGAQIQLPGGPWGAPKHPGVTKLPFPCETAYTKHQKLLCSSPILAARDDEERSIFRLVENTAEAPRDLPDRRLAWRHRTLAACEDEACALAAYDQHIAALRAIGRDLPPTSSFAQGGASGGPAGGAPMAVSPTAAPATAVAAQAAAPAIPPAQAAAAKPSFDCAKASTKVETLICSEPALAQADASTTAAFKAALPAAADQSAFRARHAEWRRKVRDACTDALCIAAAYKARLAELGR
ncbi:MAG: hypothetical protein J0L58_10625 [Burkholderiales bacterium]|nr:hypothetical protein [Burkholderiales bacterium]